MSSNWVAPPVPPTYANNPPPNDGTQVAANAGDWTRDVKGQIGDPLVSAHNDQNSALNSAFANVDADTAAIQPIGAMTAYGGTVAPTRWVLCDGGAISRTTYSALFGVIGTTWGPGDGSTTFNVPDLRGRMTIGSGQGTGLTNRTLGASAGAENAVLIGHLHTVNAGGNNISQGTGASNAADITQSNTSTVGQDETGASAPGETGVDKNMPPYNVVNFIIYAGV